MSEDDIFYTEAALWVDGSELSRAAKMVLTKKIWIEIVKDYLTQTEVYEVLAHPKENAAALDALIESRTIPDEAELKKAQAVAYILQRLAYMRAKILEDRRKDFKFRRGGLPADVE